MHHGNKMRRNNKIETNKMNVRRISRSLTPFKMVLLKIELFFVTTVLIRFSVPFLGAFTFVCKGKC